MHETFTLDPSSTPVLQARIPSGLIHITSAGANDAAELSITAADGDPETERLIEEHGIIEQRGSAMVAAVHLPHHTWFGHSPEFLLTARVPEGCTLTVGAAAADVRIEGRPGDVDVRAQSGDVTVEHLQRGGQIRTASGDARLGTAAAPVSVRTASGDVWTGGVLAPLDVKTASGDIRIDAVADARLESSSGDVRVDDAGPDGHSDIIARSASGDVWLRGVAAGRLRARAVSGQVRIEVTDGVPALLDISTISGDVDSELRPSRPAEDRPHLRLQAQTVSGDVTLLRGPARATHDEPGSPTPELESSAS